MTDGPQDEMYGSAYVAPLAPEDMEDEAALRAFGSQLLHELQMQQRRIDTVVAVKARELARVQTFYESEITVESEIRARLESDLYRVVEALQKLGTFTRRKSVPCPYGRFGYTSRAATVSVVLDDAYLAWTKAHYPDMVKAKTVESAPAQVAKDHFAATGEVPDGTALVPASDALTYKFTLGESQAQAPAKLASAEVPDATAE